MKKSLKSRFILSAMLAFLIVIVLLVGSIAFINYQEDMHRADNFLRALLDEDTRLTQSPPPNWFGYQFTQETFPAGFYTITASGQGEILSIDQIGILQSEVNVNALTAQIVSDKQTEGKVGSYQFRASYDSTDGTVHMVLLDRTTQVISLYNVLKTGALVGLACLATLFLVLQPIAGQLANEWLRKTEQQKQFITNAGHELKPPVAIILSNTEALELIEGESKYSRNIHQQTQRLDKLIKQLLMIARLDEIRYRSETETLDLTALIRESCSAFAESLSLRCDLKEGCCLRGHRQSLKQMIDVLLDNALCYAQPGTPVEVRLESNGKQAELTIENWVDKLPDCLPEALFERFYCGTSSRNPSRDSGCGIGLSAARTIVVLHRGTIRLSYPTERTFRVSILFPLHR